MQTKVLLAYRMLAFIDKMLGCTRDVVVNLRLSSIFSAYDTHAAELLRKQPSASATLHDGATPPVEQDTSARLRLCQWHLDCMYHDHRATLWLRK